ncbi:MAG: DUF4926 domain-containing protein [Clostridiales bacterium]|jgi:hypothetical protein|nr:DUF4926 domain-containing protein [Clostridiales bacterium]
MKKYDIVELINDDGTLFEKGIKKGCIGILSGDNENNGFAVLFLNNKNAGEYAVATARERDLKLLGEIPNEYKADMEKKLNAPDFFKNIRFKQSAVKEYDLVELIVDKPEYSEWGIFKGMRGCVMSGYAIMSAWQVIFSENGTGRDIADISVKEEDFKVVK